MNINPVLWQMLQESKVKVIESGYIPGGDFPKDQQQLDGKLLFFSFFFFWGGGGGVTPFHSIILGCIYLTR